MSRYLDMLPYDMAVKVAKYLPIEVLVAVLQRTDKNRIAIVDNLSFSLDNGSIACYVTKGGKRMKLLEYQIVERSASDVISFTVFKFRTISTISIDQLPNLDVNFVHALMATGVRIRNFYCTTRNVELSPEMFIEFCKKCAGVSLTSGSPGFYPILSDEVICQIVPFVKVEFWLDCFSDGCHLNISDRSLETISDGYSDSILHVDNANTLFTVKGIRKFVEAVNQDGSRPSRTMKFGVLKNQEMDDATEWLDVVKHKQDLSYSMEVLEIYNEMSTFQIWSKSNEQRRFGFNIKYADQELPIRKDDFCPESLLILDI